MPHVKEKNLFHNQRMITAKERQNCEHHLSQIINNHCPNDIKRLLCINVRLLCYITVFLNDC